MQHTLLPDPAQLSGQVRDAMLTLPMAAEFSDDEVEAIYASAYETAEAGRHEDALQYATVAALHRPSEPRYLHALALLLCEVGRYADAMTVLRVLDLLEPCTPKNVLAMAECSLGMKQVDTAIDLIEQVIEHCEDFDKPGPALDKARSLHKLLTRKEHHVH